MGHPRPLGDILRTGVRHVQSCPRCNPVDWAATPGPPHAGPVCDRVHHVRSGPGCTGLACVHAGPVRDTSLGVAHHVWVHWEEATLRSAHMARPHLRLWSTVYTHLGLGVCTSDFMSAPQTSCPHLGLHVRTSDFMPTPRTCLLVLPMGQYGTQQVAEWPSHPWKRVRGYSVSTPEVHGSQHAKAYFGRSTRGLQHVLLQHIKHSHGQRHMNDCPHGGGRLAGFHAVRAHVCLEAPPRGASPI